MQTSYRGRILNQLSVGASYTWSKSLDDASEIFGFTEVASPQSPFNRKLERGLSNFDRRHAAALNFLWDVPLMKEQKGWIGRLAGGWQLNGTYFIASGQRFTPVQQFNSFFTGIGYNDTTFDPTFFGADAVRPFTANPAAPRDSVGINEVDALLAGFIAKVTNPQGFLSLNELNRTGNAVSVTRDQVRYIINGPGAAQVFGSPFGTVSRGAEASPILNDLNLGLFKNIRLKERFKLQLRLEAFNALNHPNPGVGFITSFRNGIPNRIIESAGSQDGFNDRGGITYARRGIQLGAKIIF